MRPYVLMLNLVLAGCGVAAGGSAHKASSPIVAGAAASTPIVNRLAVDMASPSDTAGFASLEDHGVLIGYGERRNLEVPSGVASYPVRVSEAHALRAISSGDLLLADPAGRTLRFRYQRHVEHPDSNWTWVGRDYGTGREEAILTFGEKAVYGVIPRGDGLPPLRLTTRRGRSYLDMAAPGALATPSSELPDYFIPPGMAAVPNVQAQREILSSAGAAGAATLTVDVALGYTTGFAAALGGGSQAVTRLHNLVDTTNQAYINSQLGARIRLVHAMQVEFPDATSNGDALEKLTGYKPGVGAVPPDPAFAGLRAARDQYGADLVSLVRKYQEPENAGCGIAWIIGGGQSGYTNASSPFGYSVVSDGTDLDETDNKTYFCREETLAHEFGHNMGQTHNQEDASNPGVHAYSYGYRESSASGFYTVMAYRIKDSQQFSIRHFANPAVAYAGRPTGIADLADNVRSMTMVLPTVAGFRPTVVPLPSRLVPHDFNGDGRSNLAWWNSGLGAFAYWIMNGPVYTGGYTQSFSTGYVPSSIGRSTLSGRADVLVTRPTDRALVSFQSQPAGFAPFGIGQHGEGWVVVGQGDVNGDGKDDILWRHPSLGYFAYWLMDGPVYLGGQTFAPPAFYQVAAVSDFTGDKLVDIVWVDPGSRYMSMWVSVGSGFEVYQIGQHGSNWRPLGGADVTGDGKADLLWRDATNTYFAYWKMDGPVYISAFSVPTPVAYEFSTTGDYNGDGLADVVWSRPLDRALFLWSGTGVGFTEARIGQHAADWSMVK